MRKYVFTFNTYTANIGCLGSTAEILCNDADCIVSCPGYVSCKQSHIIVKKGTALTNAYVSCSGLQSCQSADIVIRDAFPLIQLDCDGASSCDTLSLNYEPNATLAEVPKSELRIYCDQEDDCRFLSFENLNVSSLSCTCFGDGCCRFLNTFFATTMKGPSACEDMCGGVYCNCDTKRQCAGYTCDQTCANSDEGMDARTCSGRGSYNYV